MIKKVLEKTLEFRKFFASSCPCFIRDINWLLSTRGMFKNSLARKKGKKF